MLKKIEKLLIKLHCKDLGLAKSFLMRRNFDSLLELVDSNIELYKKNIKKEEPNEEWLLLDENSLYTLKLLLEEYMDGLVYEHTYEEF